MAVKVKHNKTGNGTHEQRVALFKAQLQAQRKAASFLQGKHDLFKQVPMLTDGSQYEVTHVDEHGQPVSGNNASLSLGSAAAGSVGEPVDVFDPANAGKFQLKLSGTGVVGQPGEALLTEEQALEEVEAMSRNYDQ